ncbi:MAG TPA: hypothetical protein VGD76_12880, partial [Ramlibacter sp.]
SALAALAHRDSEEAASLAKQAVQRNPRYLPAWRTLLVAQVEGERLGEARGTQQQLMKRQPAFTVRAFTTAVPMGDEMQARFARALARAGTPEA